MSGDECAPESCDAVRLPVEDFLDLHAFAPREIASVVEEYLDAARHAGFDLVRLVHGRGRGIQRAAIQQKLQQNPAVADFWDAPDAHLGATVVRLHPPCGARPEASPDDGSRSKSR